MSVTLHFFIFQTLLQLLLLRVISGLDEETKTEANQVHHSEALHRYRDLKFGHKRRHYCETATKSIANAKRCSRLHHWEHIVG